MDIPISLAVIAAIITLIALYLLRPIAHSIQLLDKPSDRKKHSGSVPVIGGIAMYFGVISTIIVSPFDLNQFTYFLIAATIIVALGIYDDLKNISVSLRLFLQTLVAIIIVTAGGVYIESFGNLSGNGDLLLNDWAYFVSVLSIIAGMNAVNMADGIHGLAGGNSFITLSAILFLSNMDTFQSTIFIIIMFCAVLPIFLIHNLCIGISKKNRIFMGDAGSLLIGLIISWSLIELSQGEGKSFSPITAIWLFAMPLIEMSITIMRRLTAGISPFKPDLFHSHHLLMKLGLSKNMTLFLILFLSLLMATIGVLGELYAVSEIYMLILFLVLFFIYVFFYQLIFNKVKSI